MKYLKNEDTKHVNMAAAPGDGQTHQLHRTDLHFNENGAKWKNSSQADDDGRLHEPKTSQR